LFELKLLALMLALQDPSMYAAPPAAAWFAVKVLSATLHILKQLAHFFVGR
jgi:hypothetical protein